MSELWAQTQIREFNRKLVFVIVFFIIGHDRNRAQDTLEEYGKPVFRDRHKPHFLQKCKQGTRSSVERMADGERKPKACILPAEWKVMSLDIPIGRTFNETMLVDDCKSKENHWSLECQQDLCGALDPFQACPDGRRAHACSSRRSRGSNVSLSWVRTTN